MRSLLLSILFVAMFVSTTARASGQLDARFDGDGVRVVETAPTADGFDLD